MPVLFDTVIICHIMISNYSGTSSGCLYHPIEEEIRIVYQGQPEVPSAIRIDVTDTELHLRTYLADTWTVRSPSPG